MRAAPLALAISAGVIGCFASLIVLAGGGVDALLEGEYTRELVIRGVGGLYISIIGIAGGALSLQNPRVAAVANGAVAVSGALVLGWWWVVSGPILALAAAVNVAAALVPRGTVPWRPGRRLILVAGTAVVIAAAAGLAALIGFGYIALPDTTSPDVYTDPLGNECLEQYTTEDGICR